MDAMTAHDPHDAAERARVAAQLHRSAATGDDQMLLPCPFCGESPQLLRDGHTVAHACMVLDREIRTTVSGWNHRTQRTCLGHDARVVRDGR